MPSYRMAGIVVLFWLSSFRLSAAEYHGQVTFGGLPLPGAIVTATHEGKTLTAITDPQGAYAFPDLADGTWTIDVQMTAFEPEKQDVTIGSATTPGKFEMKPLSLDKIQTVAPAIRSAPPPPPTVSSAPSGAPASPDGKPAAPSAKNAAPAAATPDTSRELNERASDGLLINGSVNNGASSPFAQFPAFGNNRTGGHWLYNGGLGVILDNSIFDARTFSLTGQDTPKPAYSRITGVATLGGPLRIPHLMPNGPFFFLAYQWTRNNTANTQTALMPTPAERGGDLSALATSIVDPITKAPFPGNIIPASRISAQAASLLNLFPEPNFNLASSYNYQTALLSASHADAMQLRSNKNIGRRDQVYGDFAFQDQRAGNPNVFDFLDTTDTLGINTGVNWSHRYGQRLFVNLGVRFNRFSTRITPFFDNRENVSGAAGINGNDQSAANWGPPSLTFSSGIAGLGDSESAWNRNQTSSVSDAMSWSRNRHNFQFGGDFRRQEFNYLSQQNPRGSFTFTGAASGSDFADFLLGVPDAASIAYGNADKYFRESVYDGYFTDDWRMTPEFTLNAGVRWEYAAPITELYGRLVNLDVTPGFANEAPVVANDPTGPLTGRKYPDSLMAPDKSAFEPRVAIAWRPLAGSSLVVRGGYGAYYNTSVYQTIAMQMAQQSPLSKSLNVQNSAAEPLTLANGLNAIPSNSPDTFGVDPNFRVGYAQTWQASVQRDLPGSLQLTATYLGIKGARQMQEFLPNTYAPGGVDPCPACPAGYAYLTSNGNSTREAGMIQLRRRLHSGFTASLQYTYSKSIDDSAALGGQPGFSQSSGQQMGQPQGAVMNNSGPMNLALAQNWLDLSAERGLSTFDQRQLLNVQLQYTTGMGLSGGTLLNGWRGALFKDWTVLSQISAGSGLPESPIYLEPVPGTAVTNSIRPDYTGAPLYSAPAGAFLNPAAYVAPAAGEWGNAGRDSIIGPAQFTLSAALARTFRLNDRFNLDTRIDATNAFNHVNFTSWNTTINSQQFGLPVSANAMRSMQITARVRF